MKCSLGELIILPIWFSPVPVYVPVYDSALVANAGIIEPGNKTKRAAYSIDAASTVYDVRIYPFTDEAVIPNCGSPVDQID